MGTNSYWARRAVEREDEWNKKAVKLSKKSWLLNMKGPPNGYKQTLNNFMESSPPITD